MSGPRLSVRPPLPLSVYRTKPARALPWPLDDPGCRLYARARHGIWHGLRALGLTAGDELLVPAYHHGSEVEAIVKAGVVCRFYDTPPDLVPDEAELDELVRRHPAVKGLFLIHYLGFPQDAQRWKSWCEERSLVLIEDAAQAFLATVDARPVGEQADLSVFCIYKTYGVIDGAAMICPSPPPPTAVRGRPRFAQTVRRNVASIAQRSATLSRARARVSRRDRYSIETDFGLGDPDSAPALATRALLGRALATDAATGRRANFAFLLEELREHVPEGWRELPAGASPFAFPVATDAKQDLLRRLTDEGVIALNLWSVPHPELDADRFDGARRFRERVLGLPVHQELRRRDLERIIEVFSNATRT